MSKLFRAKREDLGRKINEVATSTRIKESCLAAIEEEDYDKLPIEVYARGYIKEYAKYLSLPVEDGLSPYEKYLEMKRGPKEKTVVTSTSDLPAGVIQKGIEKFQELKTDEAFCKEVKVLPVPSQSVNKPEIVKISGNKFLWKGILLLFVVLAIAYQFVSSRNAEQESRVVPMTQQPQPPQDNSPNVASPPASVLPATDEIKPPVIVPGKKRHELVISAEDTSWVQVIMDGSEKKESLLKRGESMTAEADNNISVVVGNAGGVSLKFDGKELPAGKNGEVLRLTLPEKPKVEKPAQDILPPAPQKPSPAVKRETATPKKLSDEKAMQNKLPEQPASTIKP